MLCCWCTQVTGSWLDVIAGVVNESRKKASSLSDLSQHMLADVHVEGTLGRKRKL